MTSTAAAGLQLACQAVHQRCAPHKKLRHHAHRLLGDLLAVAAELRPGLMVDYADLEPQLLAAIVCDLLEALKAGALSCEATGSWVIGMLDGCCYVLRLDLLAQRAAQQQLPAALVTFMPGSSGGGLKPVWADAATASGVAGQLSQLVLALQNAAATQQHGSGHPKGTPSQQAAGWATQRGRLAARGNGLQQASVPVPVVELEGLAGGALPMPTLSGLLLGYPAVYLVQDLDSAQAASRCLSSTSLAFYSALLAGGGAAPGLRPSSRGSTEGGGDGEGQQLLGFSVPAELAGDAHWEEQRGTWLGQLRGCVSAAAGRGFPWGGVELRVHTSPPRPIAL